jgi:hypothetical protein
MLTNCAAALVSWRYFACTCERGSSPSHVKFSGLKSASMHVGYFLATLGSLQFKLATFEDCVPLVFLFHVGFEFFHFSSCFV